MLQAQQIDELLSLVATMDRPTLVRQFHSYHADFPLDFTPAFFDRTPLDQLRHIFVAVCLQCQRIPETATAHAA